VTGLKQTIAAAFAGSSDSRFTIDDMVAEGDKVVTRWTSMGTHSGVFMGVAATGKPLTLNGIRIDRIADGKIVEMWAQLDLLGLLQQLGAMPAPAQSPA
jgi:predicted ester cyclase